MRSNVVVSQIAARSQRRIPRTSIDFIAMSVNLVIFEADNRFPFTTSFNVSSKSCRNRPIQLLGQCTELHTSIDAMMALWRWSARLNLQLGAIEGCSLKETGVELLFALVGLQYHAVSRATRKGLIGFAACRAACLSTLTFAPSLACARHSQDASNPRESAQKCSRELLNSRPTTNWQLHMISDGLPPLL